MKDTDKDRPDRNPGLIQSPGQRGGTHLTRLGIGIDENGDRAQMMDR